MIESIARTLAEAERVEVDLDSIEAKLIERYADGNQDIAELIRVKAPVTGRMRWPWAYV